MNMPIVGYALHRCILHFRSVFDAAHDAVIDTNFAIDDNQVIVFIVVEYRCNRMLHVVYLLCYQESRHSPVTKLDSW